MIYFLVGLPASGKSTYAQQMASSERIHLSSDLIRKELYGDESIQGNGKEIFQFMEERTRQAINNGYDVIYDATNLRRRDRVKFCKKFPKVTKFCLVFPFDITQSIEWDNQRERHVGEKVIRKMANSYTPPDFDEGWISIFYIQPEVKKVQKSQVDEDAI